MPPKRINKIIYIVFYLGQDYIGNDVNIPIKAFKNKKTARLYANSRNFEFQTVFPGTDREHEDYVLSNSYNDYTIAMSDLREAKHYVQLQLIDKKFANYWDALFSIEPFVIRPIEYSTDSEKEA